MPWGLFCFSFPWLQVRDWDPEMDAPEDLKREVLDNWVRYGFWTSEEFAWVHEELGNSMIVVSDFSWNGVLWLQMLHPSQCVGMEQIAGWIECTNPDSLYVMYCTRYFANTPHLQMIPLPMLHPVNAHPSQFSTLPNNPPFSRQLPKATTPPNASAVTKLKLPQGYRQSR